MEKIIELFKKSTVKLVSQDDNSIVGTGFFISDNHILTALHSISFPLNINIVYPGDWETPLKWALYKESEKLDYAIIQLDEDIPEKGVCSLGNKYQIDDKLLIIGYSIENEYDDVVTMRIEGWSRNTQNRKLLKAKGGNISRGMSGAPVLNMDTGDVIGMILETRDEESDLGGYFVSIYDILSDNDEIIAFNNNWHTLNPVWNKNKPSSKLGIGYYDQTWTDQHFYIYRTNKLSIDEILIAPIVKMIKFSDDAFDENIFELPIENLISKCIDILEAQSVLVITGSYGAGKSIFCRFFQKKLFENNNDTVFVNSYELINDKIQSRELHKLVVERFKGKSNSYIFLDAFDEISKITTTDEEEYDFFNSLVKVCKNAGVKLIINYRTLDAIDKKSQYDYPVLSILDNHNLTTVTILEFQFFNNRKINEWINNYALAMSYKVRKEALTINDVKNAHKNLISACSNPLFLYMVAVNFYDGEVRLESIRNIYDVYENFVNSTIKGKFSEERKSGNQIIRGITKEYEAFLKEVAFEIGKRHNNFVIDAKKEIDDELLLDNNENVFGISEDRIAVQISSILTRISDDQEFLNGKSISKRFLNCYFFTQNGDKWLFRNNNIMFFFLAKKVFAQIEKAISIFRDRINIEDAFTQIKEIENIPIHPIMLEMLVYKLNSLDQTTKANLEYFLKCAIEEEYFLSISEDKDSFKIDFKKVHLDIFLCILFVQINNEGYQGINFFFKRFTWYLSVAKRINPNIHFLAKRFYKTASISHAELRRLNIKGFNFDQAQLKNVKFIQNKIYNVRKNDTTFKDVEYLLCDLQNVTMDNISGSINFYNCIIDHIYINNPKKGTSLNFDRCNIKSVFINSDKRSNLIIAINNCGIGNLHITNCYVIELRLSLNIISNIKYVNSRINCIVDKNIGFNNIKTDVKSEISYQHL